MVKGWVVVFLVVILTLFFSGCKSGQVNNFSAGETLEEVTVNDRDGSSNKIINQKEKEGPKSNDVSDNESGSVKNQTEENKGEKDKPLEQAVSNVEYNKRIAWSIVRKNDHLTPGLEKTQAELANKYNAIYLGDTSKKNIYLTFDEGYENGYTPQILDTLKENKVNAAFFITMPYLEKHFDLVDRMVKEGHIVGNHTVNHPSMPDILDDDKLEQEMLKLDMMFKEKTNLSMRYLRPPKGEFSERTLKISKDLGYRNVFWSFAYADWDVNKQQGSENAFKMVSNNVHNGAVLLLHAVSKDNAEALDRIIKDLKAQGYVFRTLDDIK